MNYRNCCLSLTQKPNDICSQTNSSFIKDTTITFYATETKDCGWTTRKRSDLKEGTVKTVTSGLPQIEQIKFLSVPHIIIWIRSESIASVAIGQIFTMMKCCLSIWCLPHLPQALMLWSITSHQIRKTDNTNHIHTSNVKLASIIVIHAMCQSNVFSDFIDFEKCLKKIL